MPDLRGRIPNIRALSLALGSDYSHLHHVLKGALAPSVRLAKRIQDATGGLILWTEFFEESVNGSEAAAQLSHLDIAPGDLDGIKEVHDVAVGVNPDHEVQPDPHQRASKPEAA